MRYEPRSRQLGTFDSGYRVRRAEMLREADALRSNGEFGDDAARAEFDRIMNEIEVRDGAQTCGLSDAEADALVAQAAGGGLATVRSALFERAAQRSESLPPFNTHFGVGVDGIQRHAIVDALVARATGRPSDNPAAAEWRHASLVDIARHSIEAGGESARMLSAGAVVKRALASNTTSDFPELLTNVSNKVLRAAYGTYQGGVRRICKQSTAKDFRSKVNLQLSEAPKMQLVNEGGEYKQGAMVESKTSYALQTYGQIFGITRQAIINDDLGAFAGMATKFGRSAAEFVATQLVSLLSSATLTMSYDGVLLFHASHGNLGTPGVISITTLTEALKKMRLQTGLDGVTPIDVTPKYLIVPAALEVVAKQYVAQITAAKSSDVNPFTADLDVVVDPRLDAVSATAWYLAADSMLIDTIEYSYLDGEDGPATESRAGFEIDGVQIKVRLDFGCAVIDHRGLFKNVGV